MLIPKKIDLKEAESRNNDMDIKIKLEIDGKVYSSWQPHEDDVKSLKQPSDVERWLWDHLNIDLYESD